MPVSVTAERLSRQELSWLLAQVARSASKALKEGVNQLKPPGATPGELEDGDPPPSGTDPLEDALDVLSQLHAHPHSKTRYGRFDLAALLYDVAPDARIAIEPGAGTEVFGEESELARMLHVLVNHTHASPVSAQGSVSPEVHIRREEDQVRVSVALGPDSSATRDLEQRWLTRMATRLGGRLELEAGTHSLVLPADNAPGQQEIQELRKELEQAQQLGAVYARELAATFDSSEAQESKQALLPARSGEFTTLCVASRVVARLLKSWTALRADVAKLADSKSFNPELGQRIGRRLRVLSDYHAVLGRLASCPLEEPRSELSLDELARQAAAMAQPRAEQREVRLALDCPDRVPLTSQRERLRLLLDALLEHGIAACSAAGEVKMRIWSGPHGTTIAVEDSGPVVPSAAWASLVDEGADPSGYGRPWGASLFLAKVIASELEAKFELGESERKRAEVRLLLRG